MPDEVATLADPAAEADESLPAASEESASEPTADRESEINAQMDALIRGQIDQGRSTSKPDADDDDESADAQDGASAPTGDVKPSDAPASGQGRRGAAVEIARLKAENERLQTAYNELHPPAPDASEEARARAIATESRYRQLLVKPEDADDWTHEDIDFLVSEKKRRSLVPDLQQHYETVIQADLEAHQTAFNDWVGNFRKGVLADLATAKDVPGVDFEAVKKASTFAERDRLMYSAGAASNAAEMKRLRDENSDLKRDLLGTTRAPLNGGRSSPGRTYDENTFMDNLIRGGRV